MLKQSLTTLFLCLSFGAFSCTDKADGFFGDSKSRTMSTAQAEDPTPVPPAGAQEPAADLSDEAADPKAPPPEPVPEPMTMLLFGSGLAGVAYRYRRRRDEDESDEG